MNMLVLSSLQRKVFLHFAIIQDKDNNNTDLDRRQNFFRDTTSITSRAHAFNDWTTGAAYDYRMGMNPINSDHYNVITHKKMRLDNEQSPNTRHPMYGNSRQTKKYYPIKRRIAFDNVTDTTNWKPFYICFWWQFIDESDYTPNTQQTGVYYTYKTEVVFKNLL